MLKMIVEGLQVRLGLSICPSVRLLVSIRNYLLVLLINVTRICLYQDCFPARFGGIHFINQPWYVEAAFNMIRPFVKEKNRERIFMHGNNLTGLHHQIHK